MASAAALCALCSCSQPTHYSLEVLPYKDGKQCAISFTYDDGMLCQYTDVAPELEKRGFRGTFWIIGDRMDTESPDYPWMTWSQVADLSRRGHEMSNHTWHHPNLTLLTPDSIRQELWRCDSVLEAVTGIRPKTMAYPYNALNASIDSICREGRVATRLFQTGHGQVNSHTNADSLSTWLQSLLDNGEWGVTMTHGTTYGWDLWYDPQVLYNFYDEVKAVEDRVWVAPFAEVAAYCAERDSVQMSFACSSSGCTVSSTMPLDTALYDLPLTVRLHGGDWQDKHVVATQDGKPVAVANNDSVLQFDIVPGKEVRLEW